MRKKIKDQATVVCFQTTKKPFSIDKIEEVLFNESLWLFDASYIQAPYIRKIAYKNIKYHRRDFIEIPRAELRPPLSVHECRRTAARLSDSSIFIRKNYFFQHINKISMLPISFEYEKEKERIERDGALWDDSKKFREEAMNGLEGYVILHLDEPENSNFSGLSRFYLSYPDYRKLLEKIKKMKTKEALSWALMMEILL